MNGHIYINQDEWWSDENLTQNPHINDSYNNERYSDTSYDDLNDNGGWWNDNPAQNQYREPLHFIENQGSQDESSYNNDRWQSYNESQSCSNIQHNNCEDHDNYDNSPQQYELYNAQQCWSNDYDQNENQESSYFQDDQEESKDSELAQIAENTRRMMELMMKGFMQEEANSHAIAALENQVEQLMEQLQQQQQWEEFMQEVEESTSLNDELFEEDDWCHDEAVNVSMPEPTLPEDKVFVVELYDSSDDEEVEVEVTKQKDADFIPEPTHVIFQETEPPKVGEVILTPCPATLEKSDVAPVVVLGPEYPLVETLDCPSLATIFAHDSCHIEVLDLTPPEPVNHPPILGDLIVINTFDDKACEHNADMLPDTARELEECCSPSNMPKESKRFVCQNVKFSNKKHDPIKSHKSKIKMFKNVKCWLKNLTRRKDARPFSTKFKRIREKSKIKKFRLFKMKGIFPFDPGGIRVTYDPP